jgi:hypothetical protein
MKEGSGVRQCVPACHGHGGSGVLLQRRASHASWERLARAANMGGRRRARRGTTRLTGGAGRRRGPVAVARVRQECERVGQRGADQRARQHSVTRFGFKLIQTIQNGSTGFKFAQTLADSKGVFLCSKNWK